MGTTLELLPAVDVADGQAVRLVQGAAGTETSYGSPREAALAWQRDGAEWIHLVDLDAAFGKGNNRELLAAVVAELDVKVELSGGIRDDDSLAAAMATGCTRVNLGTAALENPDWCRKAIAEYGDRIAVGVDAKDGYVAIHGWKEVSAEPGVAFCKRLAEAGCTAIIYTDIACDGAMQGTNLSLYRQLAAEVPGVAFTASGGISSEAELLELQQMGTAAAILGKSLYTGALDLARFVQLVQN